MSVLVKFPVEAFNQIAAAKINFGTEGVGQGSPHQLKAMLMVSGFSFSETGNTFANSGIVRLATPTISGLVEQSGILPAGTYYYRVTAITSAGETLAATMDNITISATKGVQISWGAVDGAIGYKIYGRSSPTTPLLINTVGEVTTWTDTGTITPGIGTVPVADTSGAELVTGGGYTANVKVIGDRTLQRDNINRRYEIIIPQILWTLSGSITASGLAIVDTNESSLADQPIVAYVDFGGDKVETSPTDFIIPSQRIRFTGLIGS